METRSVRRLQALTSLRFVAAGAIIALHLSAHYGLPADLTLGAQLPLYLGVSFFFVLSGFILTYVYPTLKTRGDVGRFLWARFSRIWPCHAFALVVTAVAMTAYGAGASSFWSDGRALPNLASLFLVHSWAPVRSYYYAINMPSWSVATEFGFYLAFPLLLWRLDRTWPLKLAACLLVAAGLIFYCGRASVPYDAETGITTNGLLYMHPLARLFEFCVGMVTALCWRRFHPRLQFNRLLGTMIELAAFGALALNVAYWEEISTWIVVKTGAEYIIAMVWLSQTVTCLGFAALIFVAALERGWIMRALCWRGFVFLGEISYAAYLLHSIVIYIFYPYEAALARYPTWTLVSGFAAIVIGASTFSWYCVEGPTRRFLVGLLPKPGSIPAPHYTVGGRVTLLASEGEDRRESAALGAGLRLDRRD